MAADRPRRTTGGVGWRRAKLALSRLTLVCPSWPAGGELEPLVAAALEGGVDVVQLRDPDAEDAEFADAALRLRDLCDARGALFTVADRPDVAMAAAADGLHLGQPRADSREIRRAIGDDLLIGLSPISKEDVERASEFDYLFVGPVFSTPTKPGVAPVGIEQVAWAARSLRVPWFAVGGLNGGNVEMVVAAGARRLAAVRAICDADDPRAAARSLAEVLAQSGPGAACGQRPARNAENAARGARGAGLAKAPGARKSEGPNAPTARKAESAIRAAPSGEG